MIDLGHFEKIGDAWIAVIREIYSEGILVTNDDEVYKELKGVTFSVEGNIPDAFLEKHADSRNVAWMEKNFTLFNPVLELRNSHSYASRLYKYGDTKDQIEWIKNKLKENHNSRSATITMLEPLTDNYYIPCISLLDFDISFEKLNVYVYARSLDFGKKAYANMLFIWKILVNLSNDVDVKIGKMIWVCKSVHYYASDFNLIDKLLVE